MEDEQSLYVAGFPNPDRLGFIPLRHSSGDEPDESGIQLVAHTLGVPIKYVDADGYEVEIIAGAVHELGYVAYVECRSKETGDYVDVNFVIHLRVAGQPNGSWPIETYNPYFGCDVRLFGWLENSVLFIYREKHRTYACVFGPGRPALFRELADDWVINGRVIGFWKWKEFKVSRLSVPELTRLEPISEKEASDAALLPHRDWEEIQQSDSPSRNSSSQTSPAVENPKKPWWKPW